MAGTARPPSGLTRRRKPEFGTTSHAASCRHGAVQASAAAAVREGAKGGVVAVAVLYPCPAGGVEKPCSGETIVNILLNGSCFVAERVWIEEGTTFTHKHIYIYLFFEHVQEREMEEGGKSIQPSIPHRVFPRP